MYTNLSFLIDLDLCQPHYQKLLIIYLKFIAKTIKIKTVNLSVSLKGLKITNFLVIAKSIEKNTVKTNKWIKEVRYNCFTHSSAHLFIMVISSQSHLRGKQPWRTFLQYSCSVTILMLSKNICEGKLWIFMNSPWSYLLMILSHKH